MSYSLHAEKEFPQNENNIERKEEKNSYFNFS